MCSACFTPFVVGGGGGRGGGGGGDGTGDGSSRGRDGESVLLCVNRTAHAYALSRRDVIGRIKISVRNDRLFAVCCM